MEFTLLIPIIKGLGLDQPVESCPVPGGETPGQGSQFLACTRSSSIDIATR